MGIRSRVAPTAAQPGTAAAPIQNTGSIHELRPSISRRDPVPAHRRSTVAAVRGSAMGISGGSDCVSFVRTQRTRMALSVGTRQYVTAFDGLRDRTHMRTEAATLGALLADRHDLSDGCPDVLRVHAFSRLDRYREPDRSP